MRKSVITGVFACALVFAISGDKTEAASIETIEIKNAGIELSLVTKSEEHPLAEFSEEKEVKPDTNKAAKTPTTYVVKEGDTLEEIAVKHNTAWKRLYDKNTNISNPDEINPGITLAIPQPNEELASRELPVVPVAVVEQPARSSRPAEQQPQRTQTRQAVRQQPTRVSRGSSAGNLYVAGYCTWYVKNMRPDLPNNLGNAYTWVSRAAAQGMATGSSPRAGAVGQRGNHVVYVESVNSDGTVTISEMNHKGLYVRTVRTLPASYFTYIY